MKCALIFLAVGGCRLPGRDSPVPQSLADCRRLSQQGVTALERGDSEKSSTLLAKAVAACPVDVESRRHYAEALWTRGAKADAVAQLEEAARLAGEDPTIWVRLAEMRLACNQPELAKQAADRALLLDSKLPNAWAVHGGVARMANKPEVALTNYLRAASYAPTDRTILLEIAELHRQLNQPDRALQTLQSLADLYAPGEEPGQVLDLLGMAYVALGRYDDGVESYSLAVTRGQPTPEMFFHLGEAQLLAGHPERASAAVQRALAMQPQHQPSQELMQRIIVAQQSQTGVVRK